MKTFSLQKLIFLLIAGLLFTDLSVMAQSSTNQSSFMPGAIPGYHFAVGNGTIL